MNKILGKIVLIISISSVLLTVLLPTSESIGHYFYQGYDAIFSIVAFSISMLIYFVLVKEKTEDVSLNRLKLLLSVSLLLS